MRWYYDIWNQRIKNLSFYRADLLHGWSLPGFWACNCLSSCNHTFYYKKRGHQAKQNFLHSNRNNHQYNYIMPLTKALVGTRVGSTAALVPLTCYIAPYLARLIENALLEVDSGIIEAAQSMGATTLQTIFKFVLPESKGAIILGITTGTVGLLGATAMAGAVGGGGVGDLALTYGYQRFNTPLMTSTVIILIIFVQLIQAIGSRAAKKK